MKEYDAFIAHASEDKNTIVRKLAETLVFKGYRIWYDEFSLNVGDNLRRSIDKGLSNSRFGIIILSKDFFLKNYPQYELDGLLEIHMNNPGIILPIWHGISKEAILKYSPPLANIVAITSDKASVSEIVKGLEYKLGESYYYFNKHGVLQKASRKSCVSLDDRKRGFQTILSDQTDRIINKTETIIKTEQIISPFDKSLSCFEFHHWQDSKGKLSLIRSTILDKLTGNLIEHDKNIEQNDGTQFRLKLNFSLIETTPLNIILELRTTNYFSNLFTIGAGYTEFHCRFPISYFQYALIMPNKSDFSNMDIFVNDTRVQQQKNASEIFACFYKKSVNIGEKIRVTINNHNCI